MKLGKSQYFSLEFLKKKIDSGLRSQASLSRHWSYVTPEVRQSTPGTFVDSNESTMGKRVDRPNEGLSQVEILNKE